ncbi:hypothetical protein FOA52_003815 [Chlamydomonas sp. UWO 241]|nr:hypothetical protein FOA52_003815 [Chlamydomonas sp. UWO 241]
MESAVAWLEVELQEDRSSDGDGEMEAAWSWQVEEPAHGGDVGLANDERGGGGQQSSGSGDDAAQQSAGHKLQPWASNPRHISAILMRTHGLGRLERILDQHAPFLNERHVMIALSILPGIADRSRVSVLESDNSDAARPTTVPTPMEDELAARARRVRVLSLAGRLAQGFLRYLPQYGPRDVSAGVWALARLGAMPTGRWSRAVLAASARHMRAFEPRHLSSLLWGVASLGLNAPPAWTSAAMDAALRYARFGAAGSQAEAVSLWAISCILAAARRRSRTLVGGDDGDGDDDDSAEVGGAQPPASDSAWVRAYLDAAQPRLLAHEPRHLCMCLSALARLRVRPRSGFVEAALALLPPPRLRELSPGGTASVLWSLARLHYRPPRAWLIACLAEAEARLGEMSGKDMSMAVWALATLQAEPSQAWLRAFEAASLPRLVEFSPQGLSLTLWAVARLGFRPGALWMERAVGASRDTLPAFPPQALANVAWALTQLQYSPHPGWLAKLAQAAAHVATQGAPPQALSVLAVSLVKLCARGAAVAAAAGGISGSFTSAAAAARHQAAAAGLPRFVAALLPASLVILRRQARLAAAADAEAAAVAAARERRGRRRGGAGEPGGGGVPSSLAVDEAGDAVAAEAAAGAVAAAGFAPCELAGLMWAVAECTTARNAPSATWQSAAYATAAALAPTMGARSCAHVLYTVGRLPQLPGEERVVKAAADRVVWLLRHEIDSVSPQDVAGVLWVLAKLGCEPPADSLECLLGAAARLLPRSGHVEQAQALWAMSRMGVQPPPGYLPALTAASWPLLDRMPYCSLWTLLTCAARFSELGIYAPPEQWVVDVAAATARAAAGARNSLRVRAKMADGVLFALQELEYLPPGAEGEELWVEQQREWLLEAEELAGQGQQAQQQQLSQQDGFSLGLIACAPLLGALSALGTAWR